MASLLVVDDEQSMREFLEILLKRGGHRVASLGNAAAALARVEEGGIDLVLCDLRLGADDGLEVLRRVKERSPATEVVMITAFATAENAIQAMKLGAYDYVLKPFKVDELTLVVEKALEHRALLQENRVLRHRVGDRPTAAPGLMGHTPAIEEIRAAGRQGGRHPHHRADHRRERHRQGGGGAGHPRRRRPGRPPFVAVNCGAIPEGLIESELFGHVRGAFTGAAEARPGLFEVAGSGTLFLDEVGELPPQVQVKLLRALQERRIRRVGGSGDIVISARILAATNRDLGEEVKAGRFREDLYYRLNVIQLRLPPLRERREDLPEFCRHFVARFAADLGRAPPALAPETARLLAAWRWPGNLRELGNVLERAVTLCDGDTIGPELLPPALRGGEPESGPGEATASLPPGGLDLQAHLDAVERRVLEQALARTGGAKTEAARLLRMTFRSFRYRLAKFGIDGG